MSKPLRLGSAIASLTLLAAVAAGFWLRSEFLRPGPAPRVTRVEVPAGATVRSALARLAERGALHSPRAVEIYLRASGRHPRIKTGTYDIPARASAAAVVRMMEQGAVVLEQITIVEGSTFTELRRALEQHPGIVSTMRGKSDADVMAALGRAGQASEGRFFPDTYRFAARTPDIELLKLASANLQRTLDSAWNARRDGLPLRTADEALVLASIVEKETGLAAERPRIAGVFITRLRTGMRLQSDPTVIYGLGSRYDGDIRTKDLTADTPYNTYTRAGLPPTPIALPGRESIQAVTQPQESGAVYFVATGDGSGAHYFSKTLDEHNQAVKRYLARLRGQAAQARRTTSSGEQ